MKFNTRIIPIILFNYFLIVHLTGGKQYNNKLLPENVGNLYLSINIFLDCFLNHNKSLLLVGSWSDLSYNDFEFQSEFRTVNLMGIDKLKNPKDYAKKDKYYRIKDSDFENPPTPASNFVIINLSVPLLRLGLMRLKNSSFWNQNGYYIIEVTWPKNSCKDAYAVLKIIWEFEILSTVFICRDLHEKVYFYTFNPFTNQAPHIWHIYEIFKQQNGHPFTLFSYTYSTSLGISGTCDLLYFDKTRRLGGYPIRLLELFAPAELPYELHRYGVLVSNRLVTTIWTWLGASIQRQRLPARERGQLMKDGRPTGLLAELLAGGRFDMQLNLDYERDSWRNQLYTLIESGICFVARSNVERLDRGSLLSISDWLELVSLGCLLILVLSRLLDISYLDAAANLLRSLLGGPMLVRRRRLLVHVFVFTFIVLNLGVQSKLLALMAAPRLVEQLHSVRDLSHLGYRVYAEPRFLQFMTLGAKIRRIDETKLCLERMWRQRRIACVCDCWAGGALSLAFNGRLRVLDDEELGMYFVYLFRDDFCLMRTVGRVYARLFESGVLEHVQREYIKREREEHDDDEKYDTQEGIELQQIFFAFYVLVWGLVLASVSCLVELTIHVHTRRRITQIVVKETQRVCRKLRYYLSVASAR